MARIVKAFFLPILFSLFLSVSLRAQTISDTDRRGFNNLKKIKIDVDGDRKADTIRPRTYQVIINRNGKGKPTSKRNTQNWIAFDLITAKGRKINSFFKYNYGTAEQGGSYWVYALIPVGDINGDKRTDLVFYSGDDTSADTITLVSRRNRFIVDKRKHTTNDEW